MMQPDAGLEIGADETLREAIRLWDRGPDRVWSLLDVLRFAAPRFYMLLVLIGNMNGLLSSGQTITIQEDAWEPLREAIGNAASACLEMGALVSADALNRLEQTFHPNNDPGWLNNQKRLFEDVRRCLG